MKHLAYINEKDRYILENLNEVDLLNPFYFDVVINSIDDLLSFLNRINIDLLKDFEILGKYEAPLSLSLNLSSLFLKNYKKLYTKSKDEILKEEEDFLFNIVRIIATNQKNLPYIKNFKNIKRLFKNRDYNSLIQNLKLINNKFNDRKSYVLVNLFLIRLQHLKYIKIKNIPSFKYNAINAINSKILSLPKNDNESYLEKFLKTIDDKNFSFNFSEIIKNKDTKICEYDGYLNLLIKGVKNDVECFIFEDDDDFKEFILNMT